MMPPKPIDMSLILIFRNHLEQASKAGKLPDNLQSYFDYFNREVTRLVNIRTNHDVKKPLREAEYYKSTEEFINKIINDKDFSKNILSIALKYNMPTIKQYTSEQQPKLEKKQKISLHI